MRGDRLFFLNSWITSPQRVGAVAPSGAALANLMTRDCTAATAPILELGPGTGAFSSRLIQRGVREEDLTLVESGPEFVKLLQERLPRARVLCMDAAGLASVRLYACGGAGAAISGLPLLNMSTRKIVKILAGTFRQLRPGGALYQFSYGMRCPVPRPVLDRLGLRATFVGRAMMNVPPAAVYRLTRRPPTKIASAPASWAGQR
ncbi:MAG: methyltransferase domain-containing protein [Aestuariivirga sp.]|uniref:class I SAM-dependent methyltransferase n=1 Tax=Aestuariivirga sp. TaxID=2650926 RepID=UPI0025C5F374|nr:methyltransferase domain-containing protein [Aestuariivirga sp.]MCA3562593.1 methyltransferase domain-containing protein [Aestuariivirga sp.]